MRDGDRPKDMQTEQLLQLREELDELIGMRQELAPCLDRVSAAGQQKVDEQMDEQKMDEQKTDEQNMDQQKMDQQKDLPRHASLRLLIDQNCTMSHVGDRRTSARLVLLCVCTMAVRALFVVEQPSQSLFFSSQRSKPAVDAGLSDKEIFDALPLNDPWEDARMLQVFDYLMSDGLGLMRANTTASMDRVELDRQIQEKMNRIRELQRNDLGWCQFHEAQSKGAFLPGTDLCCGVPATPKVRVEEPGKGAGKDVGSGTEKKVEATIAKQETQAASETQIEDSLRAEERELQEAVSVLSAKRDVLRVELVKLNDEKTKVMHELNVVQTAERSDELHGHRKLLGRRIAEKTYRLALLEDELQDVTDELARRMLSFPVLDATEPGAKQFDDRQPEHTPSVSQVTHVNNCELASVPRRCGGGMRFAKGKTTAKPVSKLQLKNMYHYDEKGPPEKLSFPTISENTSPFSVLPAYLLVLGRKIDSAATCKDKLEEHVATDKRAKES
ncbi:unnamed protein product [Effrenium voratum]|nr:unnamed protein product [Effrenium voratum]